MNPRYAVLVPTLNAGPDWPIWIAQLAKQSKAPDEVVVLDSESSDDTATLARQHGFTVLPVLRRSFNHGGTRQFGIEHLQGRVDFVVCLTQDAILASTDAVAHLLSAFDDPLVGAAYGRQLPSKNASAMAEHARLFNYPAIARTVRPEDHRQLGFKACFLSNSFAAYRMSDLNAVGGFPKHVILGEDTSVAAKLLMSGRSIRYEASACAHHSHNYTLGEEFRRYFDTGVFHARSPWLLSAFGSAGGEGRRFVNSELRFLAQRAPIRIPVALASTLAKLLGYRAGRLERWIPLAFKRRISMFKSFWNVPPATQKQVERS